ncbi:hypothetical protein [Pedobacter boryungensis]|uniref:Uncharacterized protein n=1 Tax=Pedobacter boryungensis TaxID=869962 RepID=A0ABX2D968_9SPHI|nr:hypothetical protein [Pedobacter boryungensis]NQX30569.1 hypothetical protein [Pedobacter boryungensis]
MLKLYIPFFGYGFFIFYLTMFFWGFDEPTDVLPYINLGSSVVLFVGASTLALYQRKTAAIIGALCMLITSPLFYEVALGIGTSNFTPYLIISLGLYIWGVIGVFNVLTNRQSHTTLKRPVKIILSILPILLIFLWILQTNALRYL